MGGLLRKFISYGRANSYPDAVRMASRYCVNSGYLRQLSKLETRWGVAIFTATAPLFPRYSAVTVTDVDEKFLVRNQRTSEEFYFPTYPSVAQLSHMSEGYRSYMERKYTSENFVDVEEDDVVVDVGAFVGAFSLYAARRAKRVYAVEPAGTNYRCLVANTTDAATVVPKNIAITDQDGETSLNLSVDPTDHSLIDVDTAETLDAETVEAKRLDSLLETEPVTAVDFLKIDAEGLEPEVLRSIQRFDVAKIAVDCSPERDGQPPREEVSSMLAERGYEVRGENILFARKA